MLKPIDVQLTGRELLIARFVATRRHEDGKNAAADENKHGNKADGFNLHYQGCLAEMAAAKGLNRYWLSAGTGYHDDKDLGPEQVRGTDWPNGRLIIRPRESTTAWMMAVPWILVIQRGPTRFSVMGWIIGRDGLREEYLDAPVGRPPAYFVPVKALNPFPLPAS